MFQKIPKIQLETWVKGIANLTLWRFCGLNHIKTPTYLPLVLKNFNRAISLFELQKIPFQPTQTK